MKLNAPKFITWLVAVALIVLGVIGWILALAVSTMPGWLIHLSFWLAALGGIVLAASTYLTKV